jgi:hypothetical protein
MGLLRSVIFNYNLWLLLKNHRNKGREIVAQAIIRFHSNIFPSVLFFSGANEAWETSAKVMLFLSSESSSCHFSLDFLFSKITLLWFEV